MTDAALNIRSKVDKNRNRNARLLVEHWITNIFLPEQSGGTMDTHPERWRRNLISDLWRYYVQAYQQHGIRQLKGTLAELGIRADIVANILVYERQYSPECVQRLQGYALSRIRRS